MSDNYPKIFDENLVSARKKNVDANNFLIAEAQNILDEKILDISREFGSVLELAAGDDLTKYSENEFDLVRSKLILHHTNDVIGYLKQVLRILKPDGLFLANFFGGTTLKELREIFLESEKNSISPRIYPMIDVKDGGMLLQRAGFALPVADAEKVEVSYENAFSLMKHLKSIGESNAMLKRRKTFTSKDFMMRVAELYAQKYADVEQRIPATFEIITISGWKPDSGQQRPLKPGSGKIPLNNVL